MSERTTILSWLVNAAEGRDISWSVAVLRPLFALLSLWQPGFLVNRLGQARADDLFVIGLSLTTLFLFALVVKVLKLVEREYMPAYVERSLQRKLLKEFEKAELHTMEVFFARNGVANDVRNLRCNNAGPVDQAHLNLARKGALIPLSQEDPNGGSPEQGFFLRNDVRRYHHAKRRTLDTYRDDQTVLARFL